jgi:hypothetical protein
MRTFVPSGKLHIYPLISIFCAAVIMFGAATLLRSQTAGTASIQGTVTDNSGAVIPSAEVTATSATTGVKHVTKSDGNGLYSFPNIAIGSYSIDASATGFSHYHQTGITLDVGSSIAVNVSLKIGTTEQTVEVQAQGLSLQTEDSTLKQTVDEKTLTEMPLNGRQMTNLVTLMGGAVPAPGNDIVGSKTFYSSVVISIAGGQGNFTDYRLDGVDNNDYMTNINLPFPFPDAVAEFSVESTDLGASQGLHPGGLVNVVTKSGTNQYHGTAFEFIRNNFIDADNFFSVKKDTLHQNQYGGVFGGPIIHNRLFAFAGFQHTKSDQSAADTKAYIPTAAMQTGDFSVDLGGSCPGGSIRLVNPWTGAALAGDKLDTTEYPLNTAALALLKYFPTTSDPCGLYTFAIPNQTEENQFVTRVDWTINQKHSAYGRYFRDYYQHPSFYSPTDILITDSSGNFETVQGLALGETWVPTSRLVNSAHATITLRDIQRGPAAEGINADTIGVNAYQSAGNYLPITAGASGSKWTIYNGAPAFFAENTTSFTDDVSWMIGRHQLGFGGEFTRSEFNENNIYQGNGSFAFSGVFSEYGPTQAGAAGTGEDANLDFLTGALSSYSQSAPQLDALRAPIPTLYAMDTYHASKKLVLTGGVRWDPEYFPTDRYGRGSTFNFNNFVNGVQSSTYVNAPAGSLYWGDPGVPKAFTNGSLAQFSPRMGITYDPTGTGKTVFRLGGSMVYDLVCFFMGQNMNENPPFSVASSTVPVGQPLAFSAPWSNGSVTVNPFPRPAVPAHNSVFPLGGQYIILANHFHPPLMTQYTASVQQELGRNWQLQADFIGNRTSHNSYSYPMNDSVYIPGSSTPSNAAARYYLTLQNPTWGPYYAGGGSKSEYVLTGANASYQGLIMTIQHRSSNFVFMSNYTYSHCIDVEDSQGDTEGATVQNPNNIKEDKGNCGFDYRHVFNMSLVASSHFRFSNRLLSETVDDWQIAPLIHATDGTPLNVTLGVDNSLTAEGADRPDLANGSLVYTHGKIRGGSATNAQYLSPKAAGAFSTSPQGTFGTLGRNAFRGPKFFQFDSALVRSFPIHERTQMMLRLEAFNLLNHPNFNNPNSSLAAGSFGEITSEATYGPRIFQGAIKLSF